MPRTLEHLLGHPIREVEFSDDPLGGVLSRLSDDATWDAIERDLWTAPVTVYELEMTGIRLESTTSYGYHRVIDEGVMQRGQSKDHRPDLPQLKLMAAAAAPAGPPSACDVHAGQCADDPRSTPLLQRVRGIVGRQGLLDAGDCKRAALATRAEIAAHHDFSLVPLPLTGETATQVEQWITAIVAGAQEATCPGMGSVGWGPATSLSGRCTRWWTESPCAGPNACRACVRPRWPSVNRPPWRSVWQLRKRS